MALFPFRVAFVLVRRFYYRGVRKLNGIRLSPFRGMNAKSRRSDGLFVAEGTTARFFQPLPFLEDEAATPALGGDDYQLLRLRTPDMLQVVVDVLFRDMDARRDITRIKRFPYEEIDDPLPDGGVTFWGDERFFWTGFH